ncbi:MAG: phosphate uptake regulator PhoU [Aigarchaeota archaeon]|nr:phosphate uptake regulator PhoU [Aigarchaeota archaeon]MCX8192224.1 phosphate uptake regulator PhoU [Nitrososphaeria archaeon]MDW7986168.1 phosphate uptake regulator PhoU [Nitrososphaerota archaeon]
MKEIRSIMKSGGSLVISLPKEWVEVRGLKQGDNVELEIAKEAIIIRALSLEKTRRIMYLKYHGDMTYLINSIVAAYLLGYNTIIIEMPRTVQDLFELEFLKIKNKLMGLEILEYIGNKLTLKVLVDPLEVQPIDIIKRMWQISRESIEDSITSILEEDVQLAERVIQRDEEVDKLYFYTVRILRSCADDPTLQSRLGLTNINLLDFRVAAHLLEDINDRASEIASLTEEGILKVLDKQFLERLSISKTLLRDNHDDVYRIFFNHERELLSSVLERIEKIKVELTLSRLTYRELRIYEGVSMISRMQYDLAELSWIPIIKK